MARDEFSHLLAAIEEGLKQFFYRQRKAEPLFWEMVNYHFGWPPDAGAGASGKHGGKRLRPLLTMLTARAIKSEHEHVLPAAVGLEIIHNFSLILDDVMDHSMERRHRPTLWAGWGVNQALATGTGLYTLGLRALQDLFRQPLDPAACLAAIDAILEACMATNDAQISDLKFEATVDVSIAECLKISADRSALIACAPRVGAILSTDAPLVIDAFTQFGCHLALAYTLCDDYLGIWGREEQTGKPVTSDIVSKKKTYPVLVGFHSDEAAQESMLAVYNKQRLSERDVGPVLESLVSAGAPGKTKDLIRLHYNKALASLDATGIRRADQTGLRDLAHGLLQGGLAQ